MSGTITEIMFVDERERETYSSGAEFKTVTLGGDFNGHEVVRIEVDHSPERYPTVRFHHTSGITTVMPDVKVFSYVQTT